MESPITSNILSPQELVCLHQILSTHFVTLHDRSQVRAIRVNMQTPPSRGCEVFVTNIPRNILMQKLYDFMVLCGDIYEIRLLMDFSGFNRGMCYVKYCHKEAARKASLVLNACEIMPGYTVMIKMSFDNNKLMLMMIPKHITHQQVVDEMSSRVGDGLLSVTLTDKANKNEDTSYSVLLRYETHRHAINARKTLWPGVLLWDTFILIEWVEPQDLKMARVLYFKNFPEDKTRFELFDFLQSVINIHTIIKIHIDSGVGYIVFSSDKYRKMAKEILNDWYVFGRKLELRCKKFYLPSDSQGPHNEPQSDEIESPINDRQTCFDFMVDNVPTFHTTPVYTKEGIYNELDAIIHIIVNFLQKRFPCSTWTVLDSSNKEVLPHSNVIRLMLTVNNVKYTFILIQVCSDLSSAFNRRPF